MSIRRFGSCLRPLFQGSSRAFSTSPLNKVSSFAVVKIQQEPALKKAQVLPGIVTKYFGNSAESKKHHFGFFAAVIAGVISWMMNQLQEKTVSAAETPDPIAQKQGEIWECIGRTSDEYGGYIYHYKLRDEYDYEYHTLRAWFTYDATSGQWGETGARFKEQEDKTDWVRAKAYNKKNSEIFPATERAKTCLLVLDLEFKQMQDLGYSCKFDEKG